MFETMAVDFGFVPSAEICNVSVLITRWSTQYNQSLADLRKQGKLLRTQYISRVGGFIRKDFDIFVELVVGIS